MAPELGACLCNGQLKKRNNIWPWSVRSLGELTKTLFDLGEICFGKRPAFDPPVRKCAIQMSPFCKNQFGYLRLYWNCWGAFKCGVFYYGFCICRGLLSLEEVLSNWLDLTAPWIPLLIRGFPLRAVQSLHRFGNSSWSTFYFITIMKKSKNELQISL